MNLLLIFIIAFLPAFLWLLFFWRRFKGSSPAQWILFSFLSGMVSLLPVLGFSKIWQIFTGLEWIFWIERFSSHGLLISILSVLWLAMIEEYCKHRAVLAVGSEIKIRFNKISDGILYSITAAIGFSFLENAVYFWTIFVSQAIFTHDFWKEFWIVYLFRGLGTMLGHIVFSGIFGYFWGVAVLVEREQNELFVLQERRKMRQFLTEFISPIPSPDHNKLTAFFKILSLRTTRHFMGKKDVQKGTLSSTTLVAEGFWIASLLHTIFNMLVVVEWGGQSLTFLAVPFLSLGLVFIVNKLSGLHIISPHRSMPAIQD